MCVNWSVPRSGLIAVFTGTEDNQDDDEDLTDEEQIARALKLSLGE